MSGHLALQLAWGETGRQVSFVVIQWLSPTQPKPKNRAANAEVFWPGRFCKWVKVAGGSQEGTGSVWRTSLLSSAPSPIWECHPVVPDLPLKWARNGAINTKISWFLNAAINPIYFRTKHTCGILGLLWPWAILGMSGAQSQGCARKACTGPSMKARSGKPREKPLAKGLRIQLWALAPAVIHWTHHVTLHKSPSLCSQGWKVEGDEAAGAVPRTSARETVTGSPLQTRQHHTEEQRRVDAQKLTWKPQSSLNSGLWKPLKTSRSRASLEELRPECQIATPERRLWPANLLTRGRTVWLCPDLAQHARPIPLWVSVSYSVL